MKIFQRSQVKFNYLLICSLSFKYFWLGFTYFSQGILYDHSPLSTFRYCNSLKRHLERGLLLHYYFHPHLSMVTNNLKTFDFSVVYALRTV